MEKIRIIIILALSILLFSYTANAEDKKVTFTDVALEGMGSKVHTELFELKEGQATFYTYQDITARLAVYLMDGTASHELDLMEFYSKGKASKTIDIKKSSAYCLDVVTKDNCNWNILIRQINDSSNKSSSLLTTTGVTVAHFKGQNYLVTQEFYLKKGIAKFKITNVSKADDGFAVILRKDKKYKKHIALIVNVGGWNDTNYDDTETVFIPAAGYYYLDLGGKTASWEITITQ